MSSKDFALGLILEDERRQHQRRLRKEQEEEEKVIILQEQDFEINNTYSIQGEDDQGNSFVSPFKFEGTLDTFVFKADSNNFRATVEIDQFDVLDRQAYTDIQDITVELSHVGAFESNGSFVLSVSSYPFNERLHIQIEPLEPITVELVRTEMFIGEGETSGETLEPELGGLIGDI